AQGQAWLRYREAGPLSSAAFEQALLQVMTPQEYEARRRANRQTDIERAMPWLTRMYDLSDQQQGQVRQMLEQRIRPDGQWWLQMRQLGDALEGMLPADQLARAHQRQGQWMRRRAARRQARREDRARQEAPSPPSPAAPAEPTVTPAPGEPAEIVSLRPLRPWEQYVQRFIERYGLSADQQGQADAILDDCLQRADAYRDSRRGEFSRLEAESADATDRDRRDALTAEKAHLERPI
ncbi:unnamed protein product, partial [marine sediment metagenome]